MRDAIRLSVWVCVDLFMNTLPDPATEPWLFVVLLAIRVLMAYMTAVLWITVLCRGNSV
jgi:hypothetical protein